MGIDEIAVLPPHDTPQVTERVERLIGAVQRELSRAELQAALKLRAIGMGIDNGDIEILVLAVEEEKVGAHPVPVALRVLVRDGEGVAGWTRGVSIPSS